MDRPNRQAFAPGVSLLGGAAGGLSYEGMMRDAVALEERARRLDSGHSRSLPRVAVPQVQAARPEDARPDQARIAGR